jgi:hypothetical protein
VGGWVGLGVQEQEGQGAAVSSNRGQKQNLVVALERTAQIFKGRHLCDSAAGSVPTCDTPSPLPFMVGAESACLSGRLWQEWGLGWGGVGG